MTFNPFILAARHGPITLVMGLIAGICLPSLSQFLTPMLPPMVVALLFLSVLRMDTKALLGSLSDVPNVLRYVLALQLVLPISILGVAYAFGVHHSAPILALVLMSAAPPIVGSPNICMMMGFAPEAALKLVVAGTAILGLTVLPIFWFLPGLGDFSIVLYSAMKLFLTVILTTTAAILTRRYVIGSLSPVLKEHLDGASAILLAVLVIGLMVSLAQSIHSDLSLSIKWLAFTCVANFGLQIIVYFGVKSRVPVDFQTALGIAAGNRNMALFFISLPFETMAPIMIFLGCYQIPMYLTPLVMKYIYAK